jgi:phosphate/sulfate permease
VDLFTSASSLPLMSLLFLLFALTIAFGFEFINGFHDTANAVTTVIYTKSLPATPAVIYSGFLNFLGVMVGGTSVAFSIVNLLPVDLLIDASGGKALVMVLSLLIGGIIWNLGTWVIGLPVSTSHTLIGSILGVGIVNSWMNGDGLSGLNWGQVATVMMALVISPLLGFVLAAIGLITMKLVIRDQRLYTPPVDNNPPPSWIRAILIITCGGVSFAHGSNDGQKGMGLILLVLIGFMPVYYAMDIHDQHKAKACSEAVVNVKQVLAQANITDAAILKQADKVLESLEGKTSLAEVSEGNRWEVRKEIYALVVALGKLEKTTPEISKAILPLNHVIKSSIEFIPLWVVIGVALSLGVGTTIGYKRIVITVAEKIGKTHLTFGQGAVAEAVTAATILGAVFFHMPVSTTHVLSSGIAGTMAANNSGVQFETCRKILLAWVFTLPASIILSGTLFVVGCMLV